MTMHEPRIHIEYSGASHLFASLWGAHLFRGPRISDLDASSTLLSRPIRDVRRFCRACPGEGDFSRLWRWKRYGWDAHRPLGYDGISMNESNQDL